MARIFLALTFFIHLMATAVPREEGYQAFEAKELALLRQEGHQFTIKGSGDKFINGYSFKGKKVKRAIVISPGWSEPALMYLEVVYDLRKAGYDVYIIDHRSQGESERLIECECSHVDDYNFYIADLTKFIKDQVMKENYERIFLLGHSMGGAIAALAAARTPGLVDKVVLTAPLFEVNTGEMPEWLARLAVKTLTFLGLSEKRRPFDNDRPHTFENNRWTQSEARWNFAKRTSDGIKFSKIKYFTNRWLNEIFKMTDDVQRTARSGFLILQPTLILQSETDYYVMNPIQEEICSKAQRTCRIEKIPSSRHSLLQDVDAVREKTMTDIIDFLKN